MGGKYEVKAWNEPYEIGDMSFDHFTNNWFEMKKWVRQCKKQYHRVLVIVRKNYK